MSILDDIRAHQARSQPPEGFVPPRHEPELLYIGCSDARLDPVKNIGIRPGKALIVRNVGALVWPESETVGAALEFFIHGFPALSKVKRHIVVSGHTDCGCMKACLNGVAPGMPYLSETVAKLGAVRARVLAKKDGGQSEEETVVALAQESVRESVRNLLAFPHVRDAVRRGAIEPHGWMLDTASGSIWEMHPHSQAFARMGQDAPALAEECSR